MGLAAIRAGLKAAFQGVTGITTVLAFPPAYIPGDHTIVFGLGGFETVRAGQVRGVRWRFDGRFYVLWQEREVAEEEFDAHVRAIIDAIDDDAHLGGALTSGIAEITDGDSDWITVGTVTWRYMDFTIDVLDKGT